MASAYSWLATRSAERNLLFPFIVEKAPSGSTCREHCAVACSAHWRMIDFTFDTTDAWFRRAAGHCSSYKFFNITSKSSHAPKEAGSYRLIMLSFATFLSEMLALLRSICSRSVCVLCRKERFRFAHRFQEPKSEYTTTPARKWVFRCFTACWGDPQPMRTRAPHPTLFGEAIVKHAAHSLGRPTADLSP